MVLCLEKIIFWENNFFQKFIFIKFDSNKWILAWLGDAEMGPLNFMFHYHLIILHSIGNSMIEIFKEELRKKIINVKIASASGCRCFTDLGTNRVTKKTKYKQRISDGNNNVKKSKALLEPSSANYFFKN